MRMTKDADGAAWPAKDFFGAAMAAKQLDPP